MIVHGLYVLALILSMGGSGKSEDNTKWYFAIRSLIVECPSAPWNKSSHEFFESFRDCVQHRALASLDSLLTDDVIPVIDGIDLVRYQAEPDNSTDYRTSRHSTHNATGDITSWAETVLNRLTNVLRTHVVKIDVDRLTNPIGYDTTDSSLSNPSNVIHARRRRNKRRNSMMPLMMMGILLMGSILIPMGFQFLAVLGGKALLLAKMALILSSIQGLKKIATSGVNYGLYHAPVGETWHERSSQEVPIGQYDAPLYPPYLGQHHL